MMIQGSLLRETVLRTRKMSRQVVVAHITKVFDKKKVLLKSTPIHNEGRPVQNFSYIETCRATETDGGAISQSMSKQQSLSTEKYTIQRATEYERQPLMETRVETCSKSQRVAGDLKEGLDKATKLKVLSAKPSRFPIFLRVLFHIRNLLKRTKEMIFISF